MQILHEIVTGLEKLQQHGWLHNDIKSSNFIIHESQPGEFSGKIIDMGSAIQPPDVPRLLSKFEIAEFEKNIWLYPHVAPERFGNDRDVTVVTKATEVYSLGYLFWEIAHVMAIKELAELAEICQSSDPNLRPSLEMIVDKLDKFKHN